MSRNFIENQHKQAAIKKMSSKDIVIELYKIPADKLLPKISTATRKTMANTQDAIREEYQPTKVNPLLRIVPAASIMPGATYNNPILVNQSGIVINTSNLVTAGTSAPCLSNRLKGKDISRGFPKSVEPIFRKGYEAGKIRIETEFTNHSRICYLKAQKLIPSKNRKQQLAFLFEIWTGEKPLESITPKIIKLFMIF